MAKQQKRHVVAYVESMQCHILIHNKPTYPNIGDVESLGFTTSVQALKWHPLAIPRYLHTLLCGSLKFSTSHKEKKESYPKLEMLAESKCNQLQPEAYADI